MNKDLQELYNAREILKKSAVVTEYNNSLKKAMRAQTAPIEQASNKKVKSLEGKCKRLGDAHRFATRFLPVTVVVLAVIIGYVLLAQTVLSEYLFLDFNSFLERARAYAIEHVSDFPDMLMSANLSDDTAERIAHFNSTAFEVDCYTFLIGSVIWMTLGTIVVCGMISNKELSWSMVVVDMLLVLVMIITLMVETKTIIGVLVGVIWMSFTGIGMMWSCGVPLMIGFAFVNAVVIIGYTIYNGMAKKHTANVVPKFEKVKAWKAEIAAEKAACRQKCDKIEKAYQAKMRSYPAGYGNLPSFMLDYTTVSQLVWALENRYARNIEEARRFLDQRARDAAMQRQLTQIQRDAQAALQAAKAAEAAAREPVEVNVTIW